MNQVTDYYRIDDRVANYGDGCFTTMAVVDGRVALLERHVQRLLDNTQRLYISVDVDEVRAAITQRARQVSQPKAVLKLLISAGNGGRGYARTAEQSAHFVFSEHAFPAQYVSWLEQGISLGMAKSQLAKQPLLAGIKHCNRLEQVLIKHEASQYTCDDIVVCDTDNCIVEASAANIFWLSEGTWFTPSLEYSGVAGVMRSFLLEHLTAQGYKVVVGRFHRSAITHAESVFICNALMQVMPVVTLVTDNKVAEPHGRSIAYNRQPVNSIIAGIEQAYCREYA